MLLCAGGAVDLSGRTRVASVLVAVTPARLARTAWLRALLRALVVGRGATYALCTSEEPSRSEGGAPPSHGYVRATDCWGSLSAAPSPMSAIAARTIIAAAYDVLSRLDTRIVPAMPVPSVEPRLEMQRDRPEISPCCDSGNADCTTLTEGVRITPRPGPMKSRPGANAHALGEPLTSESKITTPTIVVMKPVMISVRCAYFFASRSAASEDTRMPPVAAVKITPV